MSSDEIEIGVLGRPHGVAGAVLLWLHNASSDLIDHRDQVILRSSEGGHRVVRVREVPRGRKGARVLRSPDIRDRDDAASLTNWKVYVPVADLPDLEEDDEFYYHEVIGLPVVTPSGRHVGTVRQVIETSTDVLIVDLDGGGELMIPVVEAFVVAVDPRGGLVRVVEDVEQYFE